MSDTYATLLIERHADGYAVVTLNRPEALNALNSALFADLAAFLDAVEHDDGVRCLILTGSGDKAFAAGADIKEMADQTYADMYRANFFALGHATPPLISKSISVTYPNPTPTKGVKAPSLSMSKS